MRPDSSDRELLADQDIIDQAGEFASVFHERFAAGAEFALVDEGQPTVSRPMPRELAQLLATVVETVAKGGTVTVGTMPEELTTTAAARLLGVSRPTLMKMIHSGEIAAHKVGTHNRLHTKDVLALRDRRLAERRRVFEELRELEDDLGL